MSRQHRSSIALLAALGMAGITQADTTAAKPTFDQVPQVRLVADTSTATTAPAETVTTESVEVFDSDTIRIRQSFDAYTTLQDGQPGRPGEIELNYSTSWQTKSGDSDPWMMHPEIKWTPKCLPDTQFGLGVPLELLNGGVDGQADIYLSWLQRWIKETPCNWWPTFSTINEIRVPNGYGSEKVDWTLTGVLAKELGPGTAYMNAFLRTANGENHLNTPGYWNGMIGNEDHLDRRHFQWGFRWGYKWRITDCFALITDYVMQSNPLYGRHNQNIGEVAAEWKLSDRLTLGPGILFGLDGQSENVNFGAGIKLHYSLN